jgi:hypothetical protein
MAQANRKSTTKLSTKRVSRPSGAPLIGDPLRPANGRARSLKSPARRLIGDPLRPANGRARSLKSPARPREEACGHSAATVFLNAGPSGCPVLPLISTIGALWDSFDGAQKAGHRTIADQIESLRIDAEEIAGSSRATSLAGMLFQTSLASYFATLLRDNAETGDQKRVDETFRELMRTLNSIGSALRDKLGEEYAAIRPVVEIYPLELT